MVLLRGRRRRDGRTCWRHAGDQPLHNAGDQVWLGSEHLRAVPGSRKDDQLVVAGCG